MQAAQAPRISWAIALMMAVLSPIAVIMAELPKPPLPQDVVYNALVPYLVAWTTKRDTLTDPRALLPWAEFLEKEKEGNPAFLVDSETLAAWKKDVQNPAARKTMGFLHEMRDTASAQGIPVFRPSICEEESERLGKFKQTDGDPSLTQLALWIVNKSWDDGLRFLYFEGINEPTYPKKLFRKPTVKSMVLELLKRAPPGGVAHLYASAGVPPPDNSPAGEK